jgi:hypothetical protein
MTHEIMLEDLKAELDHLDPAVLRSIREIINQAKRPLPDRLKARQSSDMPLIDIEEPLPFAGENLTLEEHEQLSLEERAKLKRRLKEQNYPWLHEKFSELDAAWLVVVDGQVIASGKSLKDKPRQPQVLEICRRIGKFPFVFVNDDYITIEENTSSWHATRQPGDFYPNLPVTFRSASDVAEIIGDFDTGASHTFADYDFLAANNLIRPEAGDDFETHRHLNRSFDYIDKFVRIELSSRSGKSLVLDTWIACVLDWRRSPFVVPNPNRIALVGRDIMLELKPNLRLDFDARQTEILAAAKPRRTRQKISRAKKRAKPRSSRRR